MIDHPENLPADPQLSCEIRVYYYDTDAGGVVHNIAYLRMIEEVRTRLAEHMGWSLESMARNEVAPVVARTDISYIKPARLSDTLRITGTLVRIGKSSFDLAFVAVRAGDGTEIVRCTQTMACVKMAVGRPVRTPEAWRAKWPHLCA